MKALKAAKLCLGLLLTMSSVGCIKGETGPAGRNGTDNRVIATLNCNGQISHASVLNGLYVEYSAVLTEAGDVYSTASISDDYAQYSGTSFYAAGQSGSDNASVLITYDAHGTTDAGYWNVSVDRSTLVTTAVYNDPSFSVNPVTMTFAPAACSASNW